MKKTDLPQKVALAPPLFLFFAKIHHWMRKEKLIEFTNFGNSNLNIELYLKNL